MFILLQLASVDAERAEIDGPNVNETNQALSVETQESSGVSKQSSTISSDERPGPSTSTDSPSVATRTRRGRKKAGK